MMIPELTKSARRFVVTGLLVTGLHVLVATGIIRYLLPVPTLANGAAFLTATAFSYMVNTLWSFSSPVSKENFVRFVLVSSIGFLLAVAVSGSAQYYGLHYMIGIALVACTVPPVTFLLHSFWTYRMFAREPAKH